MRTVSEPARLRNDFGVVHVKPEPNPPKTVALIADCTITTDSVVATATIRTDAKMRRIIAQWGDGAVDTLLSRPGFEVAVAENNPLPAGTYKLTHAYAGPEDKKPFDQFVQIRVEDESGVDFCIRKITLTPRYKVTNYRTTLTLKGGCDSWFESESEFEITQTVDGVPVRAWQWIAHEPSLFTGEIGDVGEDRYRLEGSMVSRELTLADAPVPVIFDIVEKDKWFDAELTIYQPLGAGYSSETVERETEDDGEGCKLGYRYDREVTLVVPLPPLGQTITIKG